MLAATNLRSVDPLRLRAWNAPEAAVPERVEAYPSMLTQGERRMLRWLAKEHYSGAGAICDLGSFLGGSTVSLADGLRAAGHSGVRIHSYDFHRIRAGAWEDWGLGRRFPYPEDGYFLPVMRQMLGELANSVAFHSGDFLAADPPDGPIEILFVDICKTLALNDHVVGRFFPGLIPGRSIVVQQDYFHPWPIFDVYVMEVLRDHFEPLAHEGKSAVFLYTRALDAAALAPALSPAMSVEAIRDGLNAAAGRWPRGGEQERITAMAQALEGLAEIPHTRRDLRAAAGGPDQDKAARRARRQARRARRAGLAAAGHGAG